VSENVRIKTQNYLSTISSKILFSMSSTKFCVSKLPTTINVNRQSTTLPNNESLPEPFHVIDRDALQRIFFYLELKDSRALHFVCRLFHKIMAPYFTCTILRISDDPQDASEFTEFCEACRGLAHPFLYQRSLSITWEQFSNLNCEFPILGILMKLPDILPIDCIVRDNAVKLSRLFTHRENLPQLKALNVQHPGLTWEEMCGWEINSQLEYLKFSGFEGTVGFDHYFGKTYPLNNLKILIANLKHNHCILEKLPGFPNITKCVINLLPVMDGYPNEKRSYDMYNLTDFSINPYKSLKSL
jgi:hypothetical protein